MDNHLLVSLLFGLGVLTQAVISTKSNFNIKALLSCMAVSALSVVSLFPLAMDDDAYYPHIQIFLYFFFFSLLFSMLLKETYLPKVTKQTVFSYNLILLYLVITNYKLAFDHPLFIMLAIATIVTFVITIINKPIHFVFKFFSYTWFMIIIISLIVSNFYLSNIIAFLATTGLMSLLTFTANKIIETPPTPTEAFITGMTYLYLFSYVYNLLALTPLLREEQGIKHHITVLVSKYSNEHIDIYAILTILFSFTSLFIINASYHLVSDILLISVLVLLTPELTKKRSDHPIPA